MDYNNIEFHLDNGLAKIVLNRPETLNSFNVGMHREFRDALERCAGDATIRCVLLTGNGRGFCAGQDLGDREVANLDEDADLAEGVEKYFNPIVRLIAKMEKPVVCAVNGVAAGAGANIAFACDIVIAARSAFFVESFCKLGLIPDTGGTWHLPRLVGMARARGMAMLGGKIPAERAEQWGLIWEVVDDDALMETTTSMARELACAPTKGLGFIKKSLLLSTANSLDEQLDFERDMMREAGRTEDYREGINAFMNKRAPVFTGR